MVFLHLGDLHIGKSMGEFSLIEDQEFILNQILEIAAEKKADAIVIAGDVYDKAIPSEEAVGVLDGFLRECANRNLQVCMISGNHDSDERLDFGSTFFRAGGIHICGKYKGVIPKAELQDAYGKVNFYLLPFVKASYVRQYFPEERIDDYNDAVALAIAKAGIDPNERNICVAHQYVSGSGGIRVSGSEGQTVRNVGTVEVVSTAPFAPFDYSALGHIHSAQTVGSENIRYSGSMLKYTKDEAVNEKAKVVPVVTMGPKGTVTVEEVPLKPLRDVRRLYGSIKELLKPENIVDKEDFIFAVLTDEDRLDDPMSAISAAYNNTVKVEYDNSHSREIAEADLDAPAEELSFEELVTRFFSDNYALDLDEDLMNILRDAAKEANILYEAD